MEECNLYQPVAQQGGSWEIKVSISLSSYPLITCQLLPSLKLPRSQSDREPMMWPIKVTLGEQIKMEKGWRRTEMEHQYSYTQVPLLPIRRTFL